MAYLASQSAINEPMHIVSRNPAYQQYNGLQTSTVLRNSQDLMNLNGNLSAQDLATVIQRPEQNSFVDQVGRPPVSQRVAPRLIINSSYANL